MNSAARKYGKGNNMKRLAFSFCLSLCSIALLCGFHSSAVAAEPAAAGKTITASADAWPIFRGDALAQGVAISKLPNQPELLWKKEFSRAAFEATAVIEGGVIYVGSNNDDASGDFFSLNLADGSERWKFHSDAGFSSAAGVRDGRVYVGNFDGRCYCLNAADGKAVWGFDAKATVHGGPNFYGDKVLFTSEDGALYCLNSADGKLAWQYTIDQPLYCSPTIVDGRVFLGGCDSAFHVIDLETGKAVTDPIDIGAQTGNAPAVLGDRAYFGTLGAGVLAIDWKKPAIAWTYVGGRRKQEYKSSAALSGGMVVLGCNDRQIRGIQAESGAEVWTFAAKGNVESSPVAVGSRVYVGSNDGRIYGLNLTTGEQEWEYETGSDVVASPAVAAGKMIIGDIDGKLYCFGAK
ncbi:MAG: PQQ-binding-like beta-propeller repeat protein [Pirellulales bacterium]